MSATHSRRQTYNKTWKRYRDFSGLVAAKALGIGAASFWSAAEKDIAESPTAIAGTPKRKSTRQQDYN